MEAVHTVFAVLAAGDNGQVLVPVNADDDMATAQLATCDHDQGITFDRPTLAAFAARAFNDEHGVNLARVSKDGVSVHISGNEIPEQIEVKVLRSPQSFNVPVLAAEAV